MLYFCMQINSFDMSTANKEVLTLSEALEYTGFSKSYMYKLTHWGRIPHYKPGGKMIFFNRVELENWLMKNRVRSNDEVEKEAIKYLNGR